MREKGSTEDLTFEGEWGSRRRWRKDGGGGYFWVAGGIFSNIGLGGAFDHVQAQE